MKVGINGFGCIGWLVFCIFEVCGVEVVVINDLIDNYMLVYLFKYDLIVGCFDGIVEYDESSLMVNGKKIQVIVECDFVNIKWGEYGVDIVIEFIGIFISCEGVFKYMQGGVKKVIIIVLVKGEDFFIVLGVNDEQYDFVNYYIIFNVSCIINSFGVLMKVIDEVFGIEKVIMIIVYSYINDQCVLDLLYSDLCCVCVVVINIIFILIGVVKVVLQVYFVLKGKFDGISLCVFMFIGLISDVSVILGCDVIVEEVNNVFCEVVNGKYKGIMVYIEDFIVLIDIQGDLYSVIIDGGLIMVMGNFVKFFLWYDNEWGYSNCIVDLVQFVQNKG